MYKGQLDGIFISTLTSNTSFSDTAISLGLAVVPAHTHTPLLLSVGAANIRHFKMLACWQGVASGVCLAGLPATVSMLPCGQRLQQLLAYSLDSINLLLIFSRDFPE